MKSDGLSNSFRSDGNDKFSRKLFRQAIIDYNQSLCHAESDKCKSLAYANRSAVYFEMKKFKLCLENIQLAKEFGYPEENAHKLHERESKCENLVKFESTENSAEKFFSLSHESHETIPFIVAGVELKSSEKYGNYLVTSGDLKTGDVIAVEEPFIKILDKHFRFERCAHCLKQNHFSLIPCDECSEGEKEN